MMMMVMTICITSMTAWVLFTIAVVTRILVINTIVILILVSVITAIVITIIFTVILVIVRRILIRTFYYYR